jgi:hypothetical protein
MRSAMMRQTLLTPGAPTVTVAMAGAVALAMAGAVALAMVDAAAVATSSAMTAPPGPEPRSDRRSTPR